MPISFKIKRHFQSHNIYKCTECGIDKWNDKPITLEIDHIDGDGNNNELANLRYLCPNCHSQTHTWKGKNIKRKVITDEELLHAINNTSNIRQALIVVGLTPKGKNYDRVSKLLGYQQIDTNNSQYNTIWVTDGSKNIKIKKDSLDEYVQCGFKRGRTTKCVPPNAKGKAWYTNGLVNTMVYPENVPVGFWPGKFTKQRRSGARRGTRTLKGYGF